jgi:hypothetical protein
MSDKTETLSAILAEMRGNEFDDPQIDADGIVGARRLARDWADRIEAAYKREHAEWHAETDAAKEERNRIACRMRYEFAAKCRACKAEPGNAAAMREALTAFAGYLTQKRIDEVWAKTTLPEPGLDRLVEQARRALAAPARNCDRFATAEEAYAAWQKHNSLTAICDWLFATAEGGAK